MGIKNFTKTVEKIIKENLTKDKNHPINDDYVGEFKYSKPNKSSLWFKKDDRKKQEKNLIRKANQNEFNIVIVLESPHIDEYKDKSFPHPALGATGNNLGVHFNKLLDTINISDNTDCHVYLMNAVPYQCSLGLNTSYFRTGIFKIIWEKHDGRNNFVDRLTKFFPNVIINLCTSDGNMQDDVQEAINEYCNNKNITTYRGPHPSSWEIKKNSRYLRDREEKKHSFV